MCQPSYWDDRASTHPIRNTPPTYLPTQFDAIMEPRIGSHSYSPIPHPKDSSCHWGRRKEPRRSIAFVVVSAVALYFCLLGFLPSPTPGNPEFASVSKIFGDANDGTAATMGVQVQNSYSSEDNTQMYPWKHTAEPHKKTVMQVIVSWKSDLQDVEFRWEFVLESKRITDTRTASRSMSDIYFTRSVHGDYSPASYQGQENLPATTWAPYAYPHPSLRPIYSLPNLPYKIYRIATPTDAIASKNGVTFICVDASQTWMAQRSDCLFNWSMTSWRRNAAAVALI